MNEQGMDKSSATASSGTTTETKNSSIVQQLITENQYYPGGYPREEKIEVLRATLKVLNYIKEHRADIDISALNGKSIVFLFKQIITTINSKLSLYIDEVIHHKKFRDLEGKWRGLHYLISNVDHTELIKIKVLCVSHKQLSKDLFANDFDGSKLFKKIYEQEIGTFGGNPFSYLLYDYYADASNVCIDFFQKLSSVAAAAHAILFTGTSPMLFNMDSFQKINQPRDIVKLFSQKPGWAALRKREDSRYLCFCLPRVLARAPYSVDNNPVDGVDYTETVDENNDNNFTYMNCIFVKATKIQQAQATHGFPVAISGVDGGGLATELSLYTYLKPSGDIAIKCPTEVSITDRREKELGDLGFIPLCHCKGTSSAAFFSTQTCKIPEVYQNVNATANSLLSVSAPNVLAASLFLHNIVIMVRNMIGLFLSAEELEIRLKNWISSYVLLNKFASQEAKASTPLRAADVQVIEVPGRVGEYIVILRVAMHNRLNDLKASIRLVSKMPIKS